MSTIHTRQTPNYSAKKDDVEYVCRPIETEKYESAWLAISATHY